MDAARSASPARRRTRHWRLRRQTDAGTVSDAGSDDSGDSGDAGDAEIGASEPADASDTGNPAPADAGGPPVTFATVRVAPDRRQHRERPGRCAMRRRVPRRRGRQAGSYTIDVGLIDGSGAPVGQLARTTTTTTGVKNVAVCPRPNGRVRSRPCWSRATGCPASAGNYSSRDERAGLPGRRLRSAAAPARPWAEAGARPRHCVSPSSAP